MEVEVCAEEPAVEKDHLPSTHLVDPDDHENEDSHANLALQMG